MAKSKTKITSILPLVSLRGRIIFPNTTSIFDIGRSISINAISRASDGDMLVFLCPQKDLEKEEITASDIYDFGTVAKIKMVSKITQETQRISVEGLYRAKARSINNESGYFYAVTEEIAPISKDENLEEAYFRTAQEVMKEILNSDVRFSKEALNQLDKATSAENYINIVSSNLHFSNEAKIELLKCEDTIDRLKFFERCLNDELEISKLERKINSMVRLSIDKNQKEYFLREQLKAIHTELGDNEEENDRLTNAVKAKKMPKEIEAKALKEIARMDKMQPASPEYTVIRNYLDWIVDLPWSEETADTENLADAVKILNDDHYGLEKIKSRITEYLAVLKLTKSMKAPILCFVGPPGVGKTSIAKSIARSLNRKFVRMSLGGVKDEAEIRGHRRTYVGAMPGRIIYAMKNAGSINPVFLLDEIDKVSSDMRGDPASALLEVLDPEQNSTFRDRFLETPYDLSKVMFITTANSVETIPAPLLDRMELIELTGYTLEEKKEIAKRYLIPKKLIDNGITSDVLEFKDKGLTSLIENYTMEAGVRSLEREIDAVCRKVAVAYAQDKSIHKKIVTDKNIESILGAKKYLKENSALENNEIGAATGLAWTSVGGTTLTIEVSTMRGKGDIQLTGKLGDVMKESAKTAISFIRANSEKYKIDSSVFENTDIHIHVPEGATPKDGPSAGITMATAILSAFTKKLVRKDIAMTGEITLRGKVLPIGGLKEKALAANRIGIKNIIIPQENKRDIEEIPEDVRKNINFILVSNVDTVFENSIVNL